MHRVVVTPPSVGVTSPLWMQRSHPGERAPKRHTETNKPAAEILEQRRSRCSAEPFMYRPELQFINSSIRCRRGECDRRLIAHIGCLTNSRFLSLAMSQCCFGKRGVTDVGHRRATRARWWWRSPAHHHHLAPALGVADHGAGNTPGIGGKLPT